MAACLLAAQWRQSSEAPQRLRITLIESAQIGTVGVGEGSTPFIRQFFARLGLDEADWMPHAQASYKSGIRFPDWSTVPGYQSYVHPFFNAQDLPTGLAFFDNANARRRGHGCDANPSDFFIAGALADLKRAPLAPPDAQGRPQPTDYAYHFDAALLGRFLQQHAQGRGVEHCQATVQAVLRHENGDIAALQLDDGSRLDADFFIDCSGFRSLLIGQTLGVPFRSWGDSLLNDRAIAIPTAQLPGAELASETVSAAMRHGWAWHIPLQSRVGHGYVYASSFVSDDEAEAELRARLGPAAEGQTARRLQMRVGCVARHWERNCLALGLSQGFIEPLEATALMLIQFAIELFIETAETQGLRAGQAHYNDNVSSMFEGVRDYVLGHYLLNTRQDTPYWQAQRALQHPSERLHQLLQVWDGGGDFDAELNRHGAALMYQRPSWYCLFAGMGRFPAIREPAPAGAMTALAARSATQAIAARFPSHRQHLQGQGLQPER